MARPTAEGFLLMYARDTLVDCPDATLFEALTDVADRYDDGEFALAGVLADLDEFQLGTTGGEAIAVLDELDELDGELS